MTTFGMKTRTRIGTWNIRTLHDVPSKLEQLAKEFVNFRLEILGIVEHRWPDSGEKNIITCGNQQLSFLYSGKPSTDARESGVGLLLSSRTRRALIDWYPISDRIIVAKFRCKVRNITIVQTYAPTNTSPESSKDNFYEQLSASLDKIKRGDILILMGDLNAKIGSDNTNRERTMGKHGAGIVNENGERLIQLCTDHNLIIGGSLFPHKNIHKLTWYSNDGQTRNQIDHIIISRRWRQSLQDVRVYRGADVHTDHKLLIGTVKLKLAAVKQKFPVYNNKLDAGRLQSPNTKSRFLQDVRETLGDNRPTNPLHRWENLKNAYTQAGAKTISRIPERRQSHISDETWEMIQQRKQANVRLDQAKTRQQHLECLRVYNNLERQVKKSARRDKRAWLNLLAERAQDAANRQQSREIYRITKQLSNRPPFIEKPVKSRDNSTPITNEEAQLVRWTEHFQQLLNPVNPAQLDNATRPETSVRIPPPKVQINTQPPTLSELKSAIKELKTGKAPGSDGLLPEFFKLDVDFAASELHPIIKHFWESNDIPEDWKKGLIVKLPKKGDLTICKNWRGIVLQNSINKIVAQILLGRLSPALEPNLRNEQAGFRRGRSCIDQTNTLRIIIEQCRELQCPLFLLFVDYSQAFDSLVQDEMWKILAAYGVPSKIIELIKQLYTDAKLSVIHRGRLGPNFTTGSGVKQGCILSPLLFNIILDYVLRETRTKNRGIQWNTFERLVDLDYADDLVAMTHTMAELKGFLDDLIRCSAKVGLKINVSKTKIMKINPPPKTRNSSDSLQIDNEKIEEVDSFIYLGSIVSKTGGTDEDVGNRIRLANAAFGSLQEIWSSGNISRRLKLQIFTSNVKSVLLYGCETWKVTKFVTNKLQVFINRCLRKICGIFYPDTISNDNLHKVTNQIPIAIEIGRRKWNWIGHTLRKKPVDITRRALSWKPPGKRRQGGQRTTWQSSALKEAAQQGKSWNELPALAANHVRWSRFVDALRFTVEQ